MSYTYCIWYRVTDDGPEAEAALRGMMARLACRTGVRGQLMKKRDEPRLWLELYQGVVDADAFETQLTEVAATYDVDMFVADARRVECFRTAHGASLACGEHS